MFNADKMSFWIPSVLATLLLSGLEPQAKAASLPSASLLIVHRGDDKASGIPAEELSVAPQPSTTISSERTSTVSDTTKGPVDPNSSELPAAQRQSGVQGEEPSSQSISSQSTSSQTPSYHRPEVEDSSGGSSSDSSPHPEVDPANYRLVLAGNIVGGIGGVAFAEMVVGMAIQANGKNKRNLELGAVEFEQEKLDEADRQIRVGRMMAIGGAIGTVALLSTSIAMIVVGRKREKERRDALKKGVYLGVPAPYAGTHGFGASWMFRF